VSISSLQTEESTRRADARLLRNSNGPKGPYNARKALDPTATESGGTSHELYDHKDAVTMTDKLELLETLDKAWRGKRCSIVTLVLK
jgi:hypothetical protein